jgi:hypothetical protein
MQRKLLGIVDHRCGFRRNRSTTDHIFSFSQILERKCKYNKAVQETSRKTSVTREVLCNILIGFGVLLKLLRLIKMCLN